MRCLLPGAFLAMLIGGIMVRAENPLPIESANVLPLAISDDFEFRKFEIFRNAAAVPGATPIPTKDLMIDLRTETQTLGSARRIGRLRPRQGSISPFFGVQKDVRTSQSVWNTVQANLKNYVQAQGIELSECEGKPYVRICDRRKRLRNRRPDYLVESDFDRGSKNCGASSVSNMAMNVAVKVLNLTPKRQGRYISGVL